MPSTPNPTAPATFTLGAAVLILASNKCGTIQATHERIDQGRQFSVRYVSDTGAICEDWFRADEIAIPKAKPARKR